MMNRSIDWLFSLLLSTLSILLSLCLHLFLYFDPFFFDFDSLILHFFSILHFLFFHLHFFLFEPFHLFQFLLDLLESLFLNVPFNHLPPLFQFINLTLLQIFILLQIIKFLFHLPQFFQSGWFDDLSTKWLIHQLNEVFFTKLDFTVINQNDVFIQILLLLINVHLMFFQLILSYNVIIIHFLNLHLTQLFKHLLLFLLHIYSLSTLITNTLTSEIRCFSHF